MTVIANVYKDAALTEAFDDASDTFNAQAVDGGSGTGSFWVGTPTATNRIQATSDPGVDPIEVSFDDSSPGSGVEESHMRLAVTEEDLATATPGAALGLGTTITGGAANAVRVWYQWDNSTGGGESTEMRMQVTARSESAIP